MSLWKLFPKGMVGSGQEQGAQASCHWTNSSRPLAGSRMAARGLSLELKVWTIIKEISNPIYSDSE